ncbi:MAG: hypothetical protein AAF549_06605 [Pseudomonadota bacterium]
MTDTKPNFGIDARDIEFVNNIAKAVEETTRYLDARKIVTQDHLDAEFERIADEMLEDFEDYTHPALKTAIIETLEKFKARISYQYDGEDALAEFANQREEIIGQISSRLRVGILKAAEAQKYISPVSEDFTELFGKTSEAVSIKMVHSFRAVARQIRDVVDAKVTKALGQLPEEREISVYQINQELALRSKFLVPSHSLNAFTVLAEGLTNSLYNDLYEKRKDKEARTDILERGRRQIISKLFNFAEEARLIPSTVRDNPHLGMTILKPE